MKISTFRIAVACGVVTCFLYALPTDAVALTQAPSELARSPASSAIEPADGVGQYLPLIVFDGANVSKMIEGVFHQEVEAILAEIGVAPTWFDGDSSHVPPLLNDYHIKVLLLASRPLSWDLPWNTLGATPPGNPRQTIVVFMPVVDMVVGGRKIARKTGRAIARVIVHELVHVMDPVRPHQEEGLMRESQGNHALYSGCLELDEASAAAFLRGLVRARAIATADDAGSEGLGG